MWGPLIFSKWLPLHERMKAFKTWLAGMWDLTNTQASKLMSWRACIAARVKGLRRAPGDDMATLWRNLHREGHGLLEILGADPVREPCLHLHRLGGHLARMANSDDDEVIGLVAFSPGQMDKHSGLHSKRF